MSVFESGPIGRAIIRRDAVQLAAALQNKRYPLLEVNEWDHSPFHLSAVWPVGLLILLKHKGASLINRADKSETLPLSYAMAHLQQGGHYGQWPGLPFVFGAQKEALLATKILLAAGSAVADSMMATDDLAFLLSDLLTRGDVSTADVVVEAFVHRRRQLLTLARTYLSPLSWDDSREPSDKLPDEDTKHLVAKLSEARITIPRACAVSDRHYTIWHRAHGKLSVPAAQKLFDAGFRDLNGHDDRGLTPLMLFSIWDHTPSSRGSMKPELLEWLVDHGGDLSSNYPRCRGDCRLSLEHRRPCSLKSVHSLAYGSGLSSSINSQTMIWTLGISGRILGLDVVDGCICACTEHGCRPGINILHDSHPYGGRYPQIYWMARISRFVSRLTSTFNSLFLALIRLWTFELLELTHTCCRSGLKEHSEQWRKPCPFSIPTEDEVHEIQDEEREIISLHQDLVLEFNDAWLISTRDPKNFFSKVYAPRMRQVKKERSEMTEEQLRDLGQLGVQVERDDETASGSGANEDDWWERIIKGDEFAHEDLYDDEYEDSYDSSYFDERDSETGTFTDSDQGSTLDRADEAGQGQGQQQEDEAREAEDSGTGSGQDDDVVSEDENDGFYGQTVEGFDDVEVAEILREAARVNGLEDYDVWFRMIGRPDPRMG